tara:strand:+ start:1607 stop:2650 length:1044 start_codon:yes stop_codon:yes gene_type:complete
VRTLADLARVCEIDTDTWKVTKWTCQKADRPVGKNVIPIFQVKAWLEQKTSVVDARAEIASLRTDAMRKPMRAARPAPKPKGDHLLELSLMDIHFGKLAWADETGHQHYDISAATSAVERSVDALLARSSGFGIGRILFVLGNDLLHADTKSGTTTAGTPLDMDSRYQKTFSRVRRVCTAAIDRLSAIAPTTVVMVPGNHDTLGTWHLGDSLSCYYRGQKGVDIFNDPRPRHYYQHGKVMLMFTHGNKAKLTDYPLIMATEQPAMFGSTDFREAHTGDKHQTKVQELHGVRVRILPALCPPDAWHSEMGFVGNWRSAEAFIWHKTEGLVGTAVYTIPGRAVKGRQIA